MLIRLDENGVGTETAFQVRFELFPLIASAVSRGASQSFKTLSPEKDCQRARNFRQARINHFCLLAKIIIIPHPICQGLFSLWRMA
jgi:hypothetical protein